MPLFHGLSAFPITPSDASGMVDTGALTTVLARIQAAGADSIGLLGSTGAYAFLSRGERRRAVETAMSAVGGKIPVIVGVGALRTDEAQALARDARELGADGLLLAPVSYTPLTDNEVYEHFAEVADAGQLPLCIYNNPGTTKFTFSVELIARLSKLGTVKAVKMPLPANGDFRAEIASLRAVTPADFAVGYSGDWGAADALLAGADGWYSVAGGLLPAEALKLTRAAQAAEAAEAKRIDDAFAPLWALFREFGSFRVMYAIADLIGLGRFSPPRPVLGLPEQARGRVREALESLGAAVGC